MGRFNLCARRTEYMLALLICFHLVILLLKAQTKYSWVKPNSIVLDLADLGVISVYT